MSDTDDIRTLIHRWAEAVHHGDLDRVLADHAEDIVMFDVPPPHDGVRGLEEYRDSWPAFFEWQRSGALFEIVELEVTAGNDVAFAHALLRCGKPTEHDPVVEPRLRLTLGLRREGDRWVVAHEHHSFADTSVPPEVAEHGVRQVHDAWSAGTRAGDLDALMSHVDAQVVSYEQAGPMQYVGLAAVRDVCASGLSTAPDGVDLDTPELTVRSGGDLAVSWGLDRIRVNRPDGSTTESHLRGTRVFERRDGEWMMIHQHLSVPAGH